tara:strand:- start:233 stop:3730 length:3498 start_codon:yes stop_codon:yes gene_type:complete
MSISFLEQSILNQRQTTSEEEGEEEKVERVLSPITSDAPSPMDYLNQSIVTEKQEERAPQVQYNIENNSAVQEAALRFVQDRLGITEITDPKEAMEEYIEHFRSFNVNELTAGGDYRYVSAAAADAAGETELREEARQKAAQRLSDYRLLYQSFSEMPNFKDGWWEATKDYGQGILTAPSTYVGLVLPGAGKAGGIAATKAAQEAVKFTLKTAFTKPITTLASKAAANPIKTAMFTEGVAGTLQNIAEQNTEIEIDLRKDYKPSETALAFGIGATAGALPAVTGVLGKGALAKQIEKGTGDIVDTAIAAVTKADKEALDTAEKTLTKNRVLSKTISSALRPLDPELVAKGQETKEGIATSSGVLPDFTITSDVNRSKRILAFGTEILSKTKEGLKEGERITEGVSRILRQLDDKKAGSGDAFFERTLKKYNLTYDDYANVFMADVSDAARTLQAAGQHARVFKRLKSVAADNIFMLDDTAKKGVEDVVNAIEKGDVRNAVGKADKLEGKDAGAGAFLRALDTARLASMTSQTATTLRNTVSGYTRVGIDTAVKAVDRGIAKFVGKGVTTPNDDIFATAYGLINKKEAKAITDIFDMGFHSKASGLFRELQDIDPKGVSGSAAVNNLKAYGKELNRLNTISDNMFKRAAFVGSLKRQLNEEFSRISRAGKLGNKTEADFNLIKIIEEGKFNSVFGTKEGTKLLDNAVEDALYTTYQKSPNSPVARAVIQGIHNAPFLTTSLIPFPRFIANAMRFTYEYSPLYIMADAFGKGAITKTAKGVDKYGKAITNYEEVAKSLVGTGILAGATAFRMSENAGENWWEYKMDDGRTFDMRPFFPAAPYLFVGDMFAKLMKDEPVFGDRNAIVDSIQALSGTQFRAGFGIYALDKALEDGINLFSDDESAETKADKFLQMGGTFVANIFSTFTIPLTLGQDTYNTFLAPDDEVIVRNNNVSNVFDLMVYKALARVPANYKMEKWLAESIGVINTPEIYQVPTREKPLRRQTPISRQTFGILLQERRNFFEDEMARLKIPRRVLSSKTGVPEADQLINTLLGEYTTDYLVPVLQNSKKYKNMSSDEQALYLKARIQDYKNDIMDVVRYNSRSAGKKRYGFDPLQLQSYKKINEVYRNKATAKYHEYFGVPADGEEYDYSILNYFAKGYEAEGKLP